MMSFRVDSLAGALVDRLLGAERCRWCDTSGAEAGLCRACADELPWNRRACPGCALPLAGGAAAPCADCRRRPPPWDLAWTAFVYGPPVAGMIHALKYQARLTEARCMARQMARALLRRPTPMPERLLPVPLHPSRQRQRGANQSLELARPLARDLSLELAPALARRRRATEDQTRLSAAERRRNLRGAFEIDAGLARGRSVAILDDVLTTGATAAELSRALKAAGAARVEVWACARTVLGS